MCTTIICNKWRLDGSQKALAYRASTTMGLFSTLYIYNIKCLQHLMLQLRGCKEDDIMEELKLLFHNLCIN